MMAKGKCVRMRGKSSETGHQRSPVGRNIDPAAGRTIHRSNLGDARLPSGPKPEAIWGMSEYPCDMRDLWRSKRRRGLVVTALVLSLMVQVLLPAFFAGAHASVPMKAIGSSYQTALICTAQGLIQVTVDENGNIIDEDDGTRKSTGTHDCIFCGPANGMVVPEAVGLSLRGPAVANHRNPSPRADASARFLFVDSLRPRAPPQDIA